MRTETFHRDTVRLIPRVAGEYQGTTLGREEGNYFTRAAAQKPTPQRFLQRIDWTAVGAGAFVYAVAFAAWSWLVR